MKKPKTNEVCPFCGFNATRVLNVPSKAAEEPEEMKQIPGHQVECINCGARGPAKMDSPMSAVHVWDHGDVGRNTRDVNKSIII